MECDRHNVLSFQAIFCSFAPSLTLKIKIWKKCKKTLPGDIILFHTCTINQDQDHIKIINQNHMMYGSWNSWNAIDRIFLSSWAIFCPFTPLTVPKKSKFQQNEKNTWRYHHLTQVYQKSWSYALFFLRYGAWQM